jgi:hypothetical protein
MGDTNSFSFYNSVLRTKTHQRVSESEQKDRSDDKIYTPPAKVIVAHQDVTEYIDGWGWELCLTSHFIASPPKQTGPKRKKFGEYSILTKRKLGSDGRTVIGVDLEIQSRSLREKLKELITIDYGIDLSADPIVIPKPYHMLFFERQMIFSYAEKQEKVAADLEDELGKKAQLPNRTEESVAEDEANLEDQRQLAQEFNLLANFIANDEDLIHTRNEFSQLEPQGMITFPLLWTIFRPGQLVRVDLDNKLECMRLKSIRLVIEENLPLYRIVGLVTEFDGSTVGESKKIVEMYPFTSTKSISKLPVVPRKHWINFESEKLQLVARGKKWYNLSKGPQHLQYDDILFSRHPEPKVSIE